MTNTFKNLIETNKKLEQLIIKLSKLLEKSKKKYKYNRELIIKNCYECKGQINCHICGYEL